MSRVPGAAGMVAGGEWDLLGCWHPCPAQHPACSLPLPQLSAAAPLVYLALLEPRLKHRSLVLYDPPIPSCSAVRSGRIFSQALLYHLVGNHIFPAVASVALSSISRHDAWTSPLQPICLYQPGTSQQPLKARAAPG